MLSLMTQRKADARPVGKGRDAPNRDPELREAAARETQPDGSARVAVFDFGTGDVA